jgi:uncharacterized protein (TIGR03435 family)
MSKDTAFRLNFAKNVAIASAGIVQLSLLIVIGIIDEPFIRAQSAAAAPPKFEVVSVKPCNYDLAARGGRGSSGSPSPGRLRLDCRTVKDLIQFAYVTFANAEGHSPWVVESTQVEGGPAWISSDRYTIDAKPADHPASPEIMRGPMMQGLLEDRFKLKLHRETKQVPVYDLTVAKGGLKLQPSREGGCIPPSIYWAKAQLPARAPGQELCRVRQTATGGFVSLEAQSMSLGEFSKFIGGLGRPLVDKTGIAGLFDFHLVYSSAEVPAGPGGGVADPAMPDAPAPPSIFTALKDLGLKLEPARGNREFFVIDHVERPSEN